MTFFFYGATQMIFLLEKKKKKVNEPANQGLHIIFFQSYLISIRFLDPFLRVPAHTRTATSLFNHFSDRVTLFSQQRQRGVSLIISCSSSKKRGYFFLPQVNERR